MAVFFARALEKKGYDMQSTITKLAAMRDYNSISAWAKVSCAVAVNSGIITGTGTTGGALLFTPHANTTWAEAVVMLERLRSGVYDMYTTKYLPRSTGA